MNQVQLLRSLLRDIRKGRGEQRLQAERQAEAMCPGFGRGYHWGGRGWSQPIVRQGEDGECVAIGYAMGRAIYKRNPGPGLRDDIPAAPKLAPRQEHLRTR